MLQCLIIRPRRSLHHHREEDRLLRRKFMDRCDPVITVFEALTLDQEVAETSIITGRERMNHVRSEKRINCHCL